jgi:hypothetical protein
MMSKTFMATILFGGGLVIVGPEVTLVVGP